MDGDSGNRVDSTIGLTGGEGGGVCEDGSVELGHQGDMSKGHPSPRFPHVHSALASPTNAVFALLILLIFSAEWWIYREEVAGDGTTKTKVQDRNFLKHPMSMPEELVVLEKTVLDKQKEIITLLTEINEMDVKMNYLRRENKKMNKLLGSYKSVLKKERALKEESKSKESHLAQSIDKNKYSEQETDSKVEQVVRIVKKGKEKADTKVLVDSDKNEYILSSPNQPSSQAIDKTLLVDIGVLITASAISGAIASALGQPILLGYLIGGSVIGPGCLGLIQQFVQVETLAQLGATFLLFGLGVEFSFANLVSFRRVAVFGGSLQILGIIAVVYVTGTFVGMEFNSSIFLGCVLAMSSTTMCVKGLMERNLINSTGGKCTVGILVMQDIALAFILAVLPVIAAGGSIHGMAIAVVAKLLAMATITLFCRRLWPVILSVLQKSGSPDLLLLGVVSLCVVMTMVTEKVLNAAEVGAFLSGMLINTAPPDVAKKALHLFEPVRDIFGALFFSSIGMLINPKFLVKQALPVSFLVVGVLVAKILILTPLIFFLGKKIPGIDLHVSLRSAISLGNIGEFTFVLANDGKEMNFLDDEMYKVLLGSAAVSLLLSPLFTSLLYPIAAKIAEQNGNAKLQTDARSTTKRSPSLKSGNEHDRLRSNSTAGN
mmetsp:Transcript_10002/g.24625  ORF Transcript_10002/g.24625 Transcript_10002/m.24625 type:complete len:659 (-) Transcript_10002:281-2257(-)|eukprot:CAMPEP_0114538926 /NCGR_PEP_ID=MMETSP0109-20121206/30412_1 /TAXON_ID=29199 /ORGANISM="Chlorarachnion reptans, Strain CCCM449" /LENGTH=658 /DNA_ID=CAMNT_0001722995 /DNA_START=132 /DNA_END=2108 /DNA_ORIENTATION=-